MSSHQPLWPACIVERIVSRICYAAVHMFFLIKMNTVGNEQWLLAYAVVIQQCCGCEAEGGCALLQPSPNPLPLHAPEGQREHLSFRQGPSKRFFETAEGLEQGGSRYLATQKDSGAVESF